MTSMEAIQFAVDQLPAIHQDPNGYLPTSRDDYADFTVMHFQRVLGPASPSSQIRVRVEQNRLCNPARITATYQVI